MFLAFIALENGIQHTNGMTAQVNDNLKWITKLTYTLKLKTYCDPSNDDSMTDFYWDFPSALRLFSYCQHFNFLVKRNQQISHEILEKFVLST